MKKQLLLLLLTTMLILSACSSKTPASKNTAAANDSSVTNSADSTSQKDEGSSDSAVEVDKGLFDVTLTIPESYVEGQTQDDLDKLCKEKGYKSITLNADGSATYVITKKQHKEMMESMADTINSSMKELVGSEDYPTFTDIKANDDYTEFTITTTSTDLSLSESIAPMLFYTYGLMYTAFNGAEADNIAVTFVNADTGKTISTSNSSELSE